MLNISSNTKKVIIMLEKRIKEATESPIQKNLCIPMFIAAQFTIAKYWKQPKCPSANEYQKTTVYLHNGILCGREKEGAYTLCNSMDGTGEHYAK